MQHYSLLVPEHVTGGELQDPLAKQDMAATPLISYPGLHAWSAVAPSVVTPAVVNVTVPWLGVVGFPQFTTGAEIQA